MEKNSSDFLFDIASNTFWIATEYLPSLAKLSNLNNLNNLKRKFSFIPDINKGSIASKSTKAQKENIYLILPETP